MDRGAQRGTWDFRRGMAVRTLQYCAVLALVSLLPIVNPEVAKTAITTAGAVAGGVIAAYLGAATTHDVLNRPKPITDPPKPPPVRAADEPIG